MDGSIAATGDTPPAVSLRLVTLTKRADFQRAARAAHVAKPGFVLQMRRREADEPPDADVIRGEVGDDVVFGGMADDTIYAFELPDEDVPTPSRLEPIETRGESALRWRLTANKSARCVWLRGASRRRRCGRSTLMRWMSPRPAAGRPFCSA